MEASNGTYQFCKSTRDIGNTQHLRPYTFNPFVFLQQIDKFLNIFLYNLQCATKENNKEPKSEMFIATRTKTGKELQADTQIAVVSFVKCINDEFNSGLKILHCVEGDNLFEYA